MWVLHLPTFYPEWRVISQLSPDCHKGKASGSVTAFKIPAPYPILSNNTACDKLTVTLTTWLSHSPSNCRVRFAHFLRMPLPALLSASGGFMPELTVHASLLNLNDCEALRLHSSNVSLFLSFSRFFDCFCARVIGPVFARTCCYIPTQWHAPTTSTTLSS